MDLLFFGLYIFPSLAVEDLEDEQAVVVAAPTATKPKTNVAETIFLINLFIVIIVYFIMKQSITKVCCVQNTPQSNKKKV